ncbi:MAG TPA: VWA domain-containing protein [Bryobacteraceae bacterium]|nr:VWA domain-containing protein [Bryobacteraceae bacterium]
MAASRLAFAQQTDKAQQADKAQSGDQTFSTDVNVVNVFVTVRDKKGNIIRDLAKDDFKVEEDNRPQTIKYFSRESDLPLTLGLLVDTSGSMRRFIEQERAASYRFFDQVLREDKDLAFVIHFDSEVELLQDLTSSRKMLEKALNLLDVAPPRQLNRRGQGDPGQPRPRAGTTLYDAVLLASDDMMRKQKGRKALILLTDGEDNGSKSTLTDAIVEAQKADTLVYAIHFGEEESYPPMMGRGMGRHGGMGRYPQQNRVDGKKILERMTQETGGGYFEGNKKQTIDQVYAQIQDELRSQYSLGYTPDKDAGYGYRKLRVTTNERSQIVQARDGYYAEK